MKRIYLDVPFRSRGIERVATALDKYVPDDTDVESFPTDAELIIFHVVGRHDHILRAAQSLLKQGKKYAVIQYSLQSTRNPNPTDWLELWNNAVLVWSYYDIAQYCKNFYHAPLAADPNVFYFEMNTNKEYMVGTNGESYAVECIGEVRHAAWKERGTTVHIGTQFDNDPNTTYFTDISDTNLRHIYNNTKWWACLRRKDGFELGAVEALLCGTRPILFDTPNYRQWFDGLAEFIPERSVIDVTEELRMLFRSGVKPVTDSEIKETKIRFNWERIITEFWKRCLE